MTHRHTILFATLVGILAGTTHALTFTTEDYPPFNMFEQRKVVGISTDILQEATKRAGVTIKVELLPWERALNMAKTEADVCVYSAVRTAEREKLFKWVGPLTSDQITLFALSTSTIKLSNLADAKKYKVGAYNGDAYGDFIEKQGIKVERVVTDTQNLPKLTSGRIDLWVAGDNSGPYKAAREGMQGKIKPLLTAGDPKDGQMYLACNPGVSDDIIKKLNEAISAMEKDGTAAKLTAKYK
ncbi:substrate-binding periplasmic protein [Chitinimonas sp. PSY-7]|uniref:transporter substrate-binding domain-containing protein n=1 Tax=Chitinimonas sp. PSY-7 TaxID=3459088 RepID=UPI0040402AB1